MRMQKSRLDGVRVQHGAAAVRRRENMHIAVLYRVCIWGTNPLARDGRFLADPKWTALEVPILLFPIADLLPFPSVVFWPKCNTTPPILALIPSVFHYF
jgi:hypothetical protein